MASVSEKRQEGLMTEGPIARQMISFALPLLLGNLFQQLYNAVDSAVVGHYVGDLALAAVGSSTSLINMIVNLFMGIAVGGSVVISQYYGARDKKGLHHAIHSVLAFSVIAGIAVTVIGYFLTPQILVWMDTPENVMPMSVEYLQIIFLGGMATVFYNMGSGLLRALGDSKRPLYFLILASLLNIVLDILFVAGFNTGVGGAALATILSQAVSGVGLAVYTLAKMPELRPKKEDFAWDRGMAGKIAQYSLLTCAQQSVMNFGILMVQGLVNSFGVSVMAAFTAAVKIDSFAYMPVQDFGNAFSTFIAQNMGAKKTDRIRRGIRSAVISAVLFCVVISAVIWVWGGDLMTIFVSPEETEIIAIGVQYLHIEGACYFGIGCLFLLYGLYRGLGAPGISVVLTVISLGTRVALAYCLAPIPQIGLVGIWWAVPIGWFLADAVGFLYYGLSFRKKMEKMNL